MKSRYLALAMMVAACGGDGGRATGPGTDAGGGGSLGPGEAGTGRLAYLVETATGRELEITNLTTGEVEYRSTEADGEVSRFFLSADGSTAVYRTAARPCTRVVLPAGTTSDCAPAGATLAYPVGISNDGSRIGFTASHGDTFQPTRVVVEGDTVVFLDDAPSDAGSQSSGSGAISPDGELFYELRFDTSVGVNPPLALWQYPVDGGSPTAIFDFTDGVSAHDIVDVTLTLSEDGTRGLFRCHDPAQPTAFERIATCTIELSTATVQRYGNAVGSLALDGSALVTVPSIGEGYRIYAFGSLTPSATITQPGGAVTLSPDASRIGFRLHADDAFYVAATLPVSGGTPVRVQRSRPSARALPEHLLWRR